MPCGNVSATRTIVSPTGPSHALLKKALHCPPVVSFPAPMDRFRVAANIEPESCNDRPLRRTIAPLTIRPVIRRLFVMRSIIEIIFAGTIRTTIVRGAAYGALPFRICPHVRIDTTRGPAPDHVHPPSPCAYRLFPAPPAWLQPAQPATPPPLPVTPPAQPATRLPPPALPPPLPALPRSPQPSPRRPYQPASAPGPTPRSRAPPRQGTAERKPPTTRDLHGVSLSRESVWRLVASASSSSYAVDTRCHRQRDVAAMCRGSRPIRVRTCRFRPLPRPHCHQPTGVILWRRPMPAISGRPCAGGRP